MALGFGQVFSEEALLGWGAGGGVCGGGRNRNSNQEVCDGVGCGMHGGGLGVVERGNTYAIHSGIMY